jgi:hypothetical protein
MKVTNTEKPKFCRRCGRHIDDALREQRNAKCLCDDRECTFREEIEQELQKQNRPPFTIITVTPPKFTITEVYKKFTIK